MRRFFKSIYTAFLATALAVLVLLPLAIIFAARSDAALSKELAAVFEPALLLRSILLPAIGACIGLVFAVPLALAAASASSRIARAAIALSLGGLVIPPFILCYVYETVFAEIGVFGYLAGSTGCVFLFALSTWPVEALFTLGAVRRETVRLENAARMHVGPWLAFKSVTLPLIMPGILTGWLFSFLLLFANFAVPQRLGVAVLSERTAMRLSLDYDLASAAVCLAPFLIVVLAALLALKLVLGRAPVTQGAVFSGRRSLSAPRLLWVPGIAGIILSVIIPVAVLAKDFTFAGLENAVGLSGREILSSVFLAAIGATLVTALGFWVAFRRMERGWKQAWPVEAVALIAFAVSGFIIAIGAKRVFGLDVFGCFNATWGVLAAAYVVRYFFLGFEGSLVGLGAFDRKLSEACRTHGAGFVKRFLFVTLPLSFRTLVAVWALAFVFVFSDVDTTRLLAPPGWETASLRLLNQVHYGYNEITSALAFVMIIITALPLGLFLFLGPRYGETRC